MEKKMNFAESTKPSVEISPVSSILNTYSSLSLSDDKRTRLSSGARRIPLRR
jgi:hypothetical protein